MTSVYTIVLRHLQFLFHAAFAGLLIGLSQMVKAEEAQQSWMWN